MNSVSHTLDSPSPQFWRISSYANASLLSACEFELFILECTPLGVYYGWRRGEAGAGEGELACAHICLGSAKHFPHSSRILFRIISGLICCDLFMNSVFAPLVLRLFAMRQTTLTTARQLWARLTHSQLIFIITERLRVATI